MKPLAGALGRLAGALGRPARRALQEAMLDDVLAACRATEGLAGTLVVTADPEAAGMARAGGARVIADYAPPRGMNPAVVRGLRFAARAGAEAALVLTADLPLAAPGDLGAVLAAAPEPPGVVLVPSRDGTGTNAMLLRPPAALAPRLGPSSLARHRDQARRRGVAALLVTRPGLALDIDTPEDLAALIAGGADCATRAACARLEVLERLGAGSVL